VADWRKGMFTIGSTPGPGALHLTQGGNGGGGGSVLYFLLFIYAYAYLYTHIYIRILTFVSLCLS